MDLAYEIGYSGYRDLLVKLDWGSNRTWNQSWMEYWKAVCRYEEWSQTKSAHLKVIQCYLSSQADYMFKSNLEARMDVI